MKLTRQTLSNIAIAAVALLLFAGFVALATRGGGKNNDKLSAVAPTSTTEHVTTTTEQETTTSELDTTTTVPVTQTTVVATTSTTRAATTPTTKKPATTTTSAFTCPARTAQSTATTDNQAAFTHNQDGSVVTSATQPNSSDPILFTIGANKAGDASGDTASIQFVLTMENNSTNHCEYFANDDANFVVTLTPSSGGAPIQFTVPAGHQDPLKPGDKLTAKQTRAVSGYGTFTATATCDVNYS